MLGAAGLGDIGELFPDTDAQHAGADSAQLLQTVVARLSEAGWQVVNVDSTVVAQAPKLAPYKAAMQTRIARLLGVPHTAVNIKAKTAEGVGPVGSGLSIEAQAVVLLVAQG
jgi:2-C-methyl-D-erythritol 4-phosphate cytidylyltransferase/2-C-methyl-D-erythritol 2,4-cyclodiphosphate synthase